MTGATRSIARSMSLLRSEMAIRTASGSERDTDATLSQGSRPYPARLPNCLQIAAVGFHRGLLGLSNLFASRGQTGFALWSGSRLPPGIAPVLHHGVELAPDHFRHLARDAGFVLGDEV